MRVWTVAAVAAMMFAGCAQAPDGPETDAGADQMQRDGTQPPSSGNGTGAGPQAGAGQGDATPRRVVLYVQEDGTLAPNLPEPGALPFPGGISAFATSQTGMGTAFVLDLQSLDDPAGGLLGAQDIQAEVWLRSDKGAASMQVFDAAVWFGTTRSMGFFAFDAKGGLIPPGGTAQHTLDLSRAEGTQVYLPPEGRFRMLVGAAYTYEEAAGNLELLVGGETATRIEFTLAPIAGPLDADPLLVQEDFSGTLEGRNPFLCGQEEGVDVLHHPVVVDPNATWLQLESSAPGFDVDLDLYDGTRHLTGAHTPTDKEALAITAEDLAPLRGRTLDLTVSGCLSASGASIPYEVAMVQRGA